jgi:hypothetical protein
MKKPRYQDHRTDVGLHAAMRAYARSKDRPSMECHVTYADGSSHVIHIFHPATKAVEYRTRDGEFYIVEVDTRFYDPDFLLDWGKDQESLTLPELKLRVQKWLEGNTPDGFRGGLCRLSFIPHN